MQRLISLVLAIGFSTALVSKAEEKSTALNFTMKSIDGKPVDLSKHQGKVVMIVNTASKCGLTPQYEGLQKLHEKYAEQGLAILAFPSNDFKQQEPGSDQQIAEFCKAEFGVTFDLFAKVKVKGDEKVDLYKHLTAQKVGPAPAGEITWNFEKFLINRNGEVIARFAPRTKPDAPEVVQAIEKELKK